MILTQGAVWAAPDSLGMEPVEFKGVSLEHPRGVSLLQDVSFSLKQGEWTALAGGSEAARRAIIRLACGVLEPGSGTVAFFGKEVVKGAPAPGIFPIFADLESQYISPVVQDDLAITLEKSGLDSKSIGKLTLDVLSEMGLDGCEKRAIGTLSGGQKKRLLLAQALVNDARVILMEEPFSMLDMAAKARLVKTLGKMRDAGRTVLMTASRVEELLAADRILALEGPGIAFDGEVAELKKREGMLRKLGLWGWSARMSQRIEMQGGEDRGPALTPNGLFEKFLAHRAERG